MAISRSWRAVSEMANDTEAVNKYMLEVLRNPEMINEETADLTFKMCTVFDLAEAEKQIPEIEEVSMKIHDVYHELSKYKESINLVDADGQHGFYSTIIQHGTVVGTYELGKVVGFTSESVDEKTADTIKRYGDEYNMRYFLYNDIYLPNMETLVGTPQMRDVVSLDNWDKFKPYFDEGMRTDVVDYEGKTFLQLAFVDRFSPEILNEIQQNYHINANVSDAYGMSPLISEMLKPEAMSEHSSDLITVFGADPNFVTDRGFTAGVVVVESIINHPELREEQMAKLEMMCEHGLDMNLNGRVMHFDMCFTEDQLADRAALNVLFSRLNVSEKDAELAREAFSEKYVSHNNEPAIYLTPTELAYRMDDPHATPDYELLKFCIEHGGDVFGRGSICDTALERHDFEAFKTMVAAGVTLEDLSEHGVVMSDKAAEILRDIQEERGLRVAAEADNEKTAENHTEDTNDTGAGLE